MMEPRNRLIRTDQDRLLAGVCGGIAAYLAISPLWVRLAFVILTAASGMGALAYALLWFLMPKERYDEFAEDIDDYWNYAGKKFHDSAARFKRYPQLGTIIATALIALGLVFMFANLGSIASLFGAAFWPLTGFVILVVVLRRLRG